MGKEWAGPVFPRGKNWLGRNSSLLHSCLSKIRVENLKILILCIISLLCILCLLYNNYHAVKHCEINYVNRYILFYINFTLILQFLNMKRPMKKNRFWTRWPGMRWFCHKQSCNQKCREKEFQDNIYQHLSKLTTDFRSHFIDFSV